MNAFQVGLLISEHTAGAVVAGTLLAAFVKDGRAAFRVSDLAKATKVGYHPVRRCLQRLQEIGVITIHSMPDRSYIITPGGRLTL